MASKLGAKPLVKFLTSTGCELCRPAFFLLQRIQREDEGFELKVINVRERKYADLYSHLCAELPVVMVGDAVIAKSKIAEAELRVALRQALGRARGE